MNKFEIEADEFRKAFADKKDKKIAIYGIGRFTATLVELVKDFNFFGLLDRDESLVGTQIYGLPVISKEQALEECDLIVINTQSTYWNVIYERIKDWNIPVYYRNGERAVPVENKQLSNNPYWKSSLDLKEAIKKYDIISFDIFDTLLMRKVFFEIDVFRLAERRIDKILGCKSNFTEIRKKCAASLIEPSINEIYEQYQRITNTPKEIIEKIKAIEIQTDIQLFSERKEVINLLKACIKQKEVYLISDMYYTADIIQGLLLNFGVNIDKKHIIVSCEVKKNKADGSLWSYYKENYVKKHTALHIGDNLKSDVENPKKYLIDTYYTMNAKGMLENSSISKIAPKIDTLYASLTMGIICNRLFNNPFALNETFGIVKFRTEIDTGFILFGAICHCFFTWLFNESKRLCIGNLLFFSREGYFLTRLAKFYQQNFNLKKKIIYLEISRRAIMSASTRTRDDIKQIVDFPYKGTTAEFLLNRFNIKKTCDLKPNEAAEIYEKEILRKTALERKSYLKYFFSKVGQKEKFAVIDSWFYGNTQYFLGKLLEKRLQGFYFCVDNQATNVCATFQNMLGCFSPNSELYKHALFVESFFTSPKGMLLYIDELGIKHYGKKMSNQRNFTIRNQMYKGIKQFIGEMIFFQKEFDLEINENDRFFSDALFGVLMDNGFKPSERMKKSFFYDNGLASKMESPVWNLV